MPSSAAPAPAVPVSAGRESVLVLPRSVALEGDTWSGIRSFGVRRLLAAIPRWGQFRSRAEVELAPQWQQIIPHLVVRSGDRLLAMRRLRSGSERRLRGQLTLGVGGHVCAADGELEAAWLAGARREWAEEVLCSRELGARAVGLIRDGARGVGEVHLGVLVMVDAGGTEVRVRERGKLEGRMATIEELGNLYLEMETWSQFAYDAILAGELEQAPLEAVELSLPASAPGSLA